jgi:hypothetical protein
MTNIAENGPKRKKCQKSLKNHKKGAKMGLNGLEANISAKNDSKNYLRNTFGAKSLTKSNTDSYSKSKKYLFNTFNN